MTTRGISVLFRNGSVLIWINSLGWSLYDTDQLHEKFRERCKMTFYCFVVSLFIALRVWECSFLPVALARRLRRCAATVSYWKLMEKSLRCRSTTTWFACGSLKSFIILAKPFCQIGRIVFQSVRKQRKVFFRVRSHCWHVEWMSGHRGRLDGHIRFLHSASSSWRHNQNTITVFYWLTSYWLVIFTCWFRSFDSDVRKILIALKSWDRVHYLHFILEFFLMFQLEMIMQEVGKNKIHSLHKVSQLMLVLV